MQGAGEPRLVKVFQKSSSLKPNKGGFSGNRVFDQVHEGDDDWSFFIDGERFEMVGEVEVRLILVSVSLGRQQQWNLLLSISPIYYTFDAFSGTVLARGSCSCIAAYFGDLTRLAGFLGSSREEHGWASGGGRHFGLFSYLGVVNVRVTPFAR